MQYLSELAFIIWFFLPAGMANMAPVFAAKWGVFKSLDKPIDRGRLYKGVRIFGNHKTYRGFVSGIITAISIIFFQSKLTPKMYAQIDPVYLGFLMGFGALTGDTVKSFFKRRVGIKPGKTWIPFDQIDFVVGAGIFTYFYYPLEWYQYLLAIITMFGLHVSAVYVGYLLKVRKDPI